MRIVNCELRIGLTFDKARLVKQIGLLETELLQTAQEILGRYLSLRSF